MKVSDEIYTKKIKRILENFGERFWVTNWLNGSTEEHLKEIVWYATKYTKRNTKIIFSVVEQSPAYKSLISEHGKERIERMIIETVEKVPSEKLASFTPNGQKSEKRTLEKRIIDYIKKHSPANLSKIKQAVKNKEKGQYYSADEIERELIRLRSEGKLTWGTMKSITLP